MVDDVKNIPQKKVSVWYFVAPLLVGIAYLFIRLIVNVNSDGAKWFDGFLWAILYIMIGGLISGIIYWALANKNQKPQGREFNGREFCRDAIRRDLLKDGIKISFFDRVQDSHRDVRWWGMVPRAFIYCELVKTKKVPPGYLLVAMNMERGHEDDIAYDHVPMNYNRDYLSKLRYEICNGMAPNPERRQSREVIQTDEMLGRSRKEKTEIPYDPEDEELEEE